MIEFYGGIMDKLHTHVLAIESDFNSGLIKYKDLDRYTSEYEVTRDEIHFRVVYTIKQIIV